jgi:Transglutaminase-like superfamily
MTRRPPRSHPALRVSALALLTLLGWARAQAQESWDAVYLGGAKIGYVHTFVEKVKDRGRDYLRVRIDIKMSLKRSNNTVDINLMYGTIETLDGEVLKLDTRTQAGQGQDLRVHGVVIGGRMKLIIEGAGEPQSKVISWEREVRGPYGPEQSMARQPMKENEERDLKIFMPELNKVCEVKLRARKIEPVLLGDGSQRLLLHVDQSTVVDGKPAPEYDARVFVDAEGQILKSEQDVLGGMVAYRTTKEAAMAPGGPVQFDLILNTVIKTAHKIPEPDNTRHVKYRITLKGSDPALAIPNDARQTLKPEADKGSAILEVASTGLLGGAPAADEPGPEYLRSNNLVTSDDARVQSLAKRVTRGVVDPWEKAARINQWVFQNIKNKNFKVAFASGAEVARRLSGDCTEHSVLATAMCRAVGIPARVAIGLIYVDDLEGFGYHMWNEVFVNHRWVALDPTWNQTDVDAVHIKLSDTSLDGVSPFEAFLPLVRVMGKLGIEPIELR